jgi:hypothetical protein
MATIVKEDEFNPDEWDLITNNKPDEWEYESVDAEDYRGLPYGEQLRAWQDFAGIEDD